MSYVSISQFMLPTMTSKKYDGCSLSLSICHVLRYSHKSLVIARQNRVRYKLLYIAWRAFPPSCVHKEPLIQQERSRSEEEAHQGEGGGGVLEIRGDVVIQGLW